MKVKPPINTLAIKALAKRHEDTPEAHISRLTAENEFLREQVAQYKKNR